MFRKKQEKFPEARKTNPPPLGIERGGYMSTSCAHVMQKKLGQNVLPHVVPEKAAEK